MPVKAKKIYKGVLKNERSMAKKEVAKAKKMVHKKKKWTVAASAMGYHAGYDSKEGFYGARGGLRNQVQPPAAATNIPAASSHMFKVSYSRRNVKGGIVVTGTQSLGIFGTVTGSTSTQAALIVGGSAVSSLALSPDAIGGQMANDARNYSYYVFKKVRILSQMNAPSTDGIGIRMAYLPDASIGSFQTITSDTIQQSRDFMSFSRKQQGDIIFDVTQLKTGQFKKYNTELDTSSSVSIRNCQQGILYFFFDVPDVSASQKFGDCLIEFELALMDRAPDYGFTLQVRDRLAALAFAGILKSRYLSMRDEYIAKRKRELTLAGVFGPVGAYGPGTENKENDEKAFTMAVSDSVVNVTDIRAYMEHSLVASFSRTMKALQAFIVNDTPTKPEPAQMQVIGFNGNQLNVDSAGDIISHVVGLTTNSVPVNLVQVGSSTVPVDSSGRMLTDIGGVGGFDVDQAVNGRIGVDLRSVNGQTVGMNNNAIAVAIKDNTANRFAAVSTSSSLQTVVSATLDEETDPDSPVQVVKKKRSKSVSLVSAPLLGARGEVLNAAAIVSGVKK